MKIIIKLIKLAVSKENVKISIGHDYLNYDQIILASHADQSLKILDDPSEEEKTILQKFKYVSNKAILHSDRRLMPKNTLAWSSWNSISSAAKLV